MKFFNCGRGRMFRVVLAMLLSVLFLGGCGGSDSGRDSGDQPRVETMLIYGSLDEEIVEAMLEAGIELADLAEYVPGKYSSILLTKESLALAANDPNTVGILEEIFAQGTNREGRVILCEPDESSMKQLLALLGANESMLEGDMSDDSLKPLYFGVGTREDDDMLCFLHYDDDDNNFGLLAVDHTNLRNWLFFEDEELEQASRDALKESGMEKNLRELAKMQTYTLSSSSKGKNYQINTMVIVVHQFDGSGDSWGGSDYFSFVQSAILDGANGYYKGWAGTRYTTIILPNHGSYYIGQGEVADNFVEKYVIDNSFGGKLEGKPYKDVAILDAQPTANNKEEQKTVTQGFNLGGSLGCEVSVEGKGPGIKGSLGLSGGYSFSQSRTVSVLDVETSMRNKNLHFAPSWEHEFKIPTQSTNWQRLDDGAKLGVSAYMPVHMWIAKMPSENRLIGKPLFLVSLEVTRGAVLTRYTGSQSPLHLKATNPAGSSLYSLSLPPLIAADKTSLVFTGSAGADTLKISSQGEWGAAVSYDAETNEEDEWIHVTKSPERLDVQVNTNDSASNRTGSIELWMKDSRQADVIQERIVIPVTQLKTVK